MHLTALYQYPIKSLGGIAMQRAQVNPWGLAYDRRWMLVKPDGSFITARRYPRMLLLQPEWRGDQLYVFHRQKDLPPLEVPMEPEGPSLPVVVWDDTVQAQRVGAEADAWFSAQLGLDCHLVYLPDASFRAVDPRYARAGEGVSFADGYPHLIIGEASLADLNARLPEPVGMDRFRPNLVFAGGTPFVEDTWQEIQIGPITFFPVKPCARCVLTTIEPSTAQAGKEPLATLSSYRGQDHKVMFGMNLLHQGRGEVQVGDELVVKR